MKKNTLGFSLFVAALLVMGLSSCVSNKAAVDSAHNSRNSLDWQGIYTGTVPSAGPGIDIRITLNADETFQLRYEYVNRDNSTYNETGSFTWDKAGNDITLNTKDTDGLRYYKVGENTLTLLDINGKVITGDLADLYVLKKLP